jgi:ribosomal protein S15P/S13E
MQKPELVVKVNEQIKNLSSKYFDLCIQQKENPEDHNIKASLVFILQNIKYFSRYLELLKIENKENMEKHLEKLNREKDIIDAIYSPRENRKTFTSGKIEMI